MHCLFPAHTGKHVIAFPQHSILRLKALGPELLPTVRGKERQRTALSNLVDVENQHIAISTSQTLTASVP
jgi:hypothetical protein